MKFRCSLKPECKCGIFTHGLSCEFTAHVLSFLPPFSLPSCRSPLGCRRFCQSWRRSHAIPTGVGWSSTFCLLVHPNTSRNHFVHCWNQGTITNTGTYVCTYSMYNEKFVYFSEFLKCLNTHIYIHVHVHTYIRMCVFGYACTLVYIIILLYLR